MLELRTSEGSETEIDGTEVEIKEFMGTRRTVFRKRIQR